MSVVVYADTTEAQMRDALQRVVNTKNIPGYLEIAADEWLLRADGWTVAVTADADLAAALWRYTNTKSAPRYLVMAANRWMAPR